MTGNGEHTNYLWFSAWGMVYDIVVPTMISIEAAGGRGENATPCQSLIALYCLVNL